VRAASKTPEETGFLAGATLAARHPMARHDHPIGALWRQRLALANAAVLARHAGRAEDEAALRPATAGVMPGICAGQVTIPGPAGRLLQAWRRVAARCGRSGCLIVGRTRRNGRARPSIRSWLASLAPSLPLVKPVLSRTDSPQKLAFWLQDEAVVLCLPDRIECYLKLVADPI
jgi:hypothetical protein